MRKIWHLHSYKNNCYNLRTLKTKAFNYLFLMAIFTALSTETLATDESGTDPNCSEPSYEVLPYDEGMGVSTGNTVSVIETRYENGRQIQTTYNYDDRDGLLRVSLESADILSTMKSRNCPANISQATYDLPINQRRRMENALNHYINNYMPADSLQALQEIGITAQSPGIVWITERVNRLKSIHDSLAADRPITRLQIEEMNLLIRELTHMEIDAFTGNRLDHSSSDRGMPLLYGLEYSSCTSSSGAECTSGRHRFLDRAGQVPEGDNYSLASLLGKIDMRDPCRPTPGGLGIRPIGSGVQPGVFGIRPSGSLNLNLDSSCPRHANLAIRRRQLGIRHSSGPSSTQD